MAGTKPSFFNQLIVLWTRLQPAQRATIVLFAVIALAGMGSVVFYMNRVDYVVAWRDLNPEDAQAIAARLQELKREYHVSSDQTMIEVAGSTADIDNLRMEIASAGLQRSGRIGYEIFDKNQFGMTDFTEQVNYKRALEGELGRTISSLSEIIEARVHLVLPKDSLFEDQKEEAKASVFVRLKKGRDLPKNSVSGIVNLVAGAVQGLPIRNISVVDAEGRVLSRLSTGDGIRSDVESGIQAQIEKDMVTKITSMLEPVVGKGRVHSNASVDLDFSSSEQTEETYNPNPPQAILSQQKSEERMSGAKPAGGVPGTRAADNVAAALLATTGPEHTRQNEVTNYEISKLSRHTVQPKGAIRRVSIAVLLDYKTVYQKGADGKTITSYAPSTKEELDKYRQLVLATVGYDEQRGDTVTLENMPFFSEPAVEEERVAVPWYIKYQTYLMPAMKYTAFLLLFLIAYLLLVRPVRKRVFQSLASVTPALPAGQGDALQISGEGASALADASGASAQKSAASLPAASAQALATASFAADIDPELMRDGGAGPRKYELLKKKIIELANNDPEQVSQLVRAWIHE